jgi:hypothetical protein
MFKIREFSQLGQVSVKTLRYYDQLGLLKPAHTDPIYAPVDFGALHGENATVVCENVFPRPNFQTADLLEQHRLLCKVADLVDSDVLQTTLTERN